MTPLPAIDSLTPEAIRVLCAEKLGWKRIPCRGGVVRPDGEWVERMFAYSKAIEIATPPFTISADAALELCAWMAAPERGWRSEITIRTGTWREPCKQFVCAFVSCSQERTVREEADTFALAVAKAFCVAQGMAV